MRKALICSLILTVIVVCLVLVWTGDSRPRQALEPENAAAAQFDRGSETNDTLVSTERSNEPLPESVETVEMGTDHSTPGEDVLSRAQRQEAEEDPERPVDQRRLDRGQLLFGIRCQSCHRTSPNEGDNGMRSPDFFGDFWGQKRIVHIGWKRTTESEAQWKAGFKERIQTFFERPVRTVVFDDKYFRESVMHPHAKIVKGSRIPMLEGLSRVETQEEVEDLLAYVKSLSQTTER